MTTYYDDIKRVTELDLPWETLDGANILIVGASGLIGRALVDVLMQLPDKMFHLYAGIRDWTYARNCFLKYADTDSFTLIQCDVTIPISLEIDFHYIIHAASYAGPYAFQSDPVSVMKANIWGVDNLFSYGKRNHLKRFLYISSGEVYGEGDGTLFHEENSGYLDWTSLRACYPMAKRAAETLCLSYAAQYQIETLIARPCHIYGPFFTFKDDRVYAQLIRNAVANEDIVLKSLGLQRRSWCYVVDCVFALLYILLKGETANAYNIADMQSNASICEFAEMIAMKSGQKVVYDIPDSSVNNHPVISQAIFNTDKINKTGWFPRWKLEEGVSHTLNTFCRA